MEKQLVVLIARQRSGTNFLRNVLDSNPELTCFGEIFDISDYALDKDWSYFNYVRKNFASEALLPNRHLEIFERFVAHLHEVSPTPATLIDIKINSLHHISQPWRGVIEDPPLLGWLAEYGAKVIWLKRSNLLRFAVSQRLADDNRIWHVEGTGGLKSQRLRLEPKPTLTYLKYLRDEEVFLDRMFARLIQEAGLKLRSLEYEDMVPELGKVSGEFLGKIASFIGIEDRFELGEGHWNKSVIDPLDKVIENFDEVSATLAGTPFAKFLRDERMHRPPPPEEV